MEQLAALIFSVAAIALVCVLVLMVFISRYLLICHPNEVIILSGRRRRMADGSTVGYRIIRGGRALRIPLIEKGARMSLETIPLTLSVQNAYSKGGIPLRVEAIANVKVDSTEPTLGNAIERFLGMPEAEVHKIAKDTLEGNLRGVLATLTPEEVNEDRLKFAQSLIDEADSDLKMLGLHLDTLKIQNVSDEAGYLDSIGRRKTAEVLSVARKAEAERAAEAEEAEANSRQRAETAKARAGQAIKTAQIDAELEVKNAQAGATSAARKTEATKTAEAEETEAVSKQRAEVARAKADQTIKQSLIDADQVVKVTRAKADTTIAVENNNLRVRKAELEKGAIIKEKEAIVAGEKAQVQFEQEVEQERIILQQKKLTADVIEPAKAKKEAMELEAIGEAASIIQDGEATLKILRQKISTYQSAGQEGERIFMLDMLPDITKMLVETVGKVTIDKVTVIDTGTASGGGNGVGRFINQIPSAAISLAEQIETATGVDIFSKFKKGEAAAGPACPVTPPCVEGEAKA